MGCGHLMNSYNITNWWDKLVGNHVNNKKRVLSLEVQTPSQSMTTPSTTSTINLTPLKPHNPLEPPKKCSLMEEDLPGKSLFKLISMDKNPDLNMTYHQRQGKGIEETDVNTDSILLSKDEMHRIHEPWRHSIIVKLFGKRVTHQFLRNKLIELWKSTEPLILIDLRCDFYIVKFSLQEKTNKYCSRARGLQLVSF